MPGAVFIRSDFVLPAGQTVSFSEPWWSPDDPYSVYHAGYRLMAPTTGAGIHVYAAGTINVTDGQSSGAVYGIGDFNIALTMGELAMLSAGAVTIGATGALNMTVYIPANLGQPTVYGYFSASGYFRFQNDGSVTVTNLGSNSSAYGVAMGGWGNSQIPGGTSIVNTGAITVTAAYGAGVALGPGTVLNNSGSIVARGGAQGVQVSNRTGGTIHIINSGQIIATPGASPSVGINASSGGNVGAVTIDNSGVITADHAIEFSPAGLATLVLHNTGTINGSILLDHNFPGAQITNAGAINGDVQLRNQGNDIYDGRGGTLSGTLKLGDGFNVVFLGNDGETVYAGYGGTLLLGGAGADHFYGGAGDDIVSGGGGDDILDGGGGVNTLSFHTAAGGVTLSLAVTSPQNTGSAGRLTVAHFQNIIGSLYADHLTGDAGNNVIDGGGGDDVIDGGGGINTIAYSSAPSGVRVSLALQGSVQNTGYGNQTLRNFQNILGSAYADHLTGDGWSNVIDGGGGDDVLDGGGGISTVSFASATRGVNVSLALQGQAQDTLVGHATLLNFHNLTGSRYDDVLAGDAGDNVIDGGGGTNTVSYPRRRRR